jgi:DNA-binding HxlR family transcriptional regulator
VNDHLDDSHVIGEITHQRWAVLVLRLLDKAGPARYSELIRRVHQHPRGQALSDKVLTDTLQLLRRYGLVVNDVGHDHPARYQISGPGQRFLAALAPLEAWVARQRRYFDSPGT